LKNNLINSSISQFGKKKRDSILAQIPFVIKHEGILPSREDLFLFFSARVHWVTKGKIVKSILMNVYQEFVTMELAKTKSILINVLATSATMVPIAKPILTNVKMNHVSMEIVLMRSMIFLVNARLDGLVRSVMQTLTTALFRVKI